MYLNVWNLIQLIASSASYDFVVWHFKIKIYNTLNQHLSGELDCKGDISFTPSGLLSLVIGYTDYDSGTAMTRTIQAGHKLVISLITYPNVGGAYSEFYRFITELHPRINPKLVYKRIIDEYQEGLSTQLFKKSDNILYDKD